MNHSESEGVNMLEIRAVHLPAAAVICDPAAGENISTQQKHSSSINSDAFFKQIFPWKPEKVQNDPVSWNRNRLQEEEKLKRRPAGSARPANVDLTSP